MLRARWTLRCYAIRYAEYFSYDGITYIRSNNKSHASSQSLKYNSTSLRFTHSLVSHIKGHLPFSSKTPLDSRKRSHHNGIDWSKAMYVRRCDTFGYEEQLKVIRTKWYGVIAQLMNLLNKTNRCIKAFFYVTGSENELYNFQRISFSLSSLIRPKDCWEIFQIWGLIESTSSRHRARNS